MRGLSPGLYGIADATFGDPVEMARALVAAGCRTIQLRAKHYNKDEIHSAAGAIRSLVRDGLFIVNDHLDVARTVGADGVHLGQQDAALSTARAQLGPDAIIGISTHTLGQVRRAQGASYIGFGPVFSTATKENPGSPKGIEALRSAVEISSIPVVAIGGITTSTLEDVRGSGVHCWAVIRAIVDCPDISTEAKRFLIKP